jgi:hypothetical protein
MLGMISTSTIKWFCSNRCAAYASLLLEQSFPRAHVQLDVR